LRGTTEEPKVIWIGCAGTAAEDGFCANTMEPDRDRSINETRGRIQKVTFAFAVISDRRRR